MARGVNRFSEGRSNKNKKIETREKNYSTRASGYAHDTKIKRVYYCYYIFL